MAAFTAGDTGTAEHLLEGKRFVVDFQLHLGNRSKLIAAFGGSEGIILMQGGKEACRYDSDHEPLFRQESNFHYLFGVKEPGALGAIELSTGKATLFVPRFPPEYAVWMGPLRSLESFKELYGVDGVMYVDELESYLSTLSPGTIYTLYGKNSDSGAFTTTQAVVPNADQFNVDSTKLHPLLTECRAIKSALELQVMRYVTDIACDSHFEVMQKARPGLAEYQMESLFKHNSYYFGGCRYQAYTSICGSGCNGAVLHYGHAGAPNDKIMQDGDMCLFDMGSECHGYASDVTCSFPCKYCYHPHAHCAAAPFIPFCTPFSCGTI